MAAKDNNTTPMPAPPDYFKEFTDENIRNNSCPKPPKIPTDAVKIFGTDQCSSWGTVRPLETYNFPRLHPQYCDHRKELKKMVQSVAIGFLDLLDILTKVPDSRERNQRIDDLMLLFIHIHHMINEFRPHQARESLKLILEVQKRRRETLSQNLKKVIDKCTESLSEAKKILEPDPYDII